MLYLNDIELNKPVRKCTSIKGVRIYHSDSKRTNIGFCNHTLNAAGISVGDKVSVAMVQNGVGEKIIIIAKCDDGWTISANKQLGANIALQNLPYGDWETPVAFSGNVIVRV